MKFIKGFLPAMLAFAVLTANAAVTVTGTVTSTDGKPLKGVYVSDGLKIVKTDSKGKYKIKSDKKDGTVFVITPTGYVAPSKDGFQPGFWALLDKDSRFCAPAGKSGQFHCHVPYRHTHHQRV